MAKPTVPAETIAAALRRAHGEVTEFAPVGEGQESQAFGFRHAGEPMVVRVNHEPEGFHKDAYAAARVASPFIPVPEVIAIDALDDDHHYCVTRRAPGTRLQDCDAAELRELSGPVGDVLTAIAAADIGDLTGFGDFDAVTGTAPHPTWRHAVRSSGRHDWAAHAGIIDPATIETLVDELDRLTEDLPDIRQLIHCDFGADNVLAHRGAVSAVLDWECAMIGDGRYDIANLLFWAPWLTCMRVQAEHAIAGLPGDPAAHDRLRGYLLAIGLDNIAYFADRADAVRAREVLARTLAAADGREWSPPIAAR